MVRTIVNWKGDNLPKDNPNLDIFITLCCHLNSAPSCQLATSNPDCLVTEEECCWPSGDTLALAWPNPCDRKGFACGHSWRCGSHRICALTGPPCSVRFPSLPPKTVLGIVGKKGNFVHHRPALTILPKLQCQP